MIIENPGVFTVDEFFANNILRVALNRLVAVATNGAQVPGGVPRSFRTLVHQRRSLLLESRRYRCMGLEATSVFGVKLLADVGDYRSTGHNLGWSLSFLS